METKDFAETFLGNLARDDFHAAGSLAAYLALVEAKRSGDEANIVDLRVSRTLIEALGYVSSEYKYNTYKDSLRADYVVEIAKYPGCCFVVEDKNTTEKRLETHRKQLASYMVLHRSTRGLLINGERIIGYDDAGPAASGTLEFPLGAAVRLWRGEDLLAGGKTGWDALPQAEQDALTVLLRRYGRAAFESASRLVDDLTLDRDGQPHEADGSSWLPGRTRLPLTDARAFPGQLVEAIQELIGDIRADVAVQYAARQRDHVEFLADVARAPGSAALANDVMDEIEGRMLNLPAVAPMRDALRSRLRQAMRGELPEGTVDVILQEIHVVAGGQRNARAPEGLRRAAADAQAFAGRYGRHLSRARERHSAGVEAVEACNRWQAAVGTLLLAGMTADRAVGEYFAQTAYLVIVRMLLVRIFEDKGLTPRVFTNGGAALWFRQVEPHYFSLAIGRSAARLLEIAYENAQTAYAHFYDDHQVFDWYVPDRNMVIRVLHRLAGFDLSAIDRDIIGTVYGRFVNERHKHEQGMYYTPPAVVGFILDRIGWSGRAIVGARLLDPACGSGAFLVEAARRAVEAHRDQARADGHADIPPERIQDVLDSLRDSLVGLDLNPFACALAEINLVVQVLDLVARARRAGLPARLDRFRVYPTDTLRVRSDVRAALEAGLDRTAAEDLPDEEQAKAGLGHFADGFDAIVANPPYVRADEGAMGLLDYRRKVEGHPITAVSDVLTMKWDLFVPFVALGLHLLRRPNGRLGMIVSNALETVPYAAGLRGQLAATATVSEVHFFEPGVKLFEDAAVRNTILIAEARPPGEGSTTLREWHDGPPPLVQQRQSLPQVAYGAQVFRPVLPTLRVRANVQAVAVKHICYISKAMVLHAHEKHAPGQFKLDDLLRGQPDATHAKPYVGSEDLRITSSPAGDFLFAPARIRYLEYGTARVPALVSRPTFPELYDREKAMVGEFGGSVHDDGTLDPHGFLTSNHSVFLFVPWRLFKGVRRRSLEDRAKELGCLRSDMEALSASYPLPFLVGLFNSATWDRLMAGRATTSIAGRAQPDNFAGQPVPTPSPELAAAVGQAATAARAEGRALASLLAAGWRRHPQGWSAPPVLDAAVQRAAFGVARTRWGLTIERPSARCGTLRREGGALLAGRQVAARFAPGTSPEAADFLLRVIAAQGGATLEAAEAAGLPVPLRPEDAAAAERASLAAEAAARQREQVIIAHRNDIDALLTPLFEPVPHPPMDVAVRL